MAEGMNRLCIEVGTELFRFESKQQWVDKAQGWFRHAVEEQRIYPGDFLCVDARGRLCLRGEHFSRAESDSSYPVVVYAADRDA